MMVIQCNTHWSMYMFANIVMNAMHLMKKMYYVVDKKQSFDRLRFDSRSLWSQRVLSNFAFPQQHISKGYIYIEH
jgi:uncharacterized membrane protein YcgQ (UPF0703/DUF1980 family)